MHITQRSGILFLVIVQAFVLIRPAILAGSIHSQAVLVETFVSRYGTTDGPISALTTLDQSNMDNDPGNYVRFNATDVPYYGDMMFLLPDDMKVERITSALVQVNFNGPPHTQQKWTWLIHDWTIDQWHSIGDSIGTQPGQWNNLIFRIPAIARYISPSGEVQIRLTSDTRSNSAKIDYIAIHMTYTPAIPTATRPTETARATKPAVTYAITYTPTLTFTPTNTPTATFTPTPTPTPTCAAFDNAFECQVFFLLNQERTSRGIPPLISNVLLHASARGHSNDMAQNDFFSHTGSNGSSFSGRITAAGYIWSACAENIAAGYPTPADVVAAWMDSPGHRTNILNPTYVHIGIGYVYDENDTIPNGPYFHYWTTDFGKPLNP